MQKWVRFCAALCGFLALSACFPIPPETQLRWTSDIDMALDMSPVNLQAKADGGDRHAMVAYSVVLRYGLHGVPVDAATADVYVGQATRPLSYQTSFIWVGATKKSPGHMIPVTTPVYDYLPAQADVVANCAEILAPQDDPPGLDAKLEKGVCGGADNYHRLKAKWHNS